MAAMTVEPFTSCPTPEKSSKTPQKPPKRFPSPTPAIDSHSKRVSKKKKTTKELRASLEPPPTRIIQTDVANFRSIVQQLTSGVSPAPSRAPSPSPFPSPSASPSPIASPSPMTPPQTTTVSPQRSPLPPSAPKTNQRLRSLAPPPIRPTPVNGSVGFRPFAPPFAAPSIPPRKLVPSASASPLRSDATEDTVGREGHGHNQQSPSSSSPATEEPGVEARTIVSNLTATMALPPNFHNMPGSPFFFSPHWLSPLPHMSPRDMFFAQMDSPGSLAMNELAARAMASGGTPGSTRFEGLPASVSLSLPSPQFHPMMQAFQLGPAFAMAPHLTYGVTMAGGHSGSGSGSVGASVLGTSAVPAMLSVKASSVSGGQEKMAE